MSTKSLSFVAAAPLLVALLTACSQSEPAQEPIRSVKLFTVGVQAMHTGGEFAGEVRAKVESRLGFRVAGKIIRRGVEPGQRVKAGEVLAQLDPQDYKLSADAARALLAAAATNRDLAAADYKRYQELKEQNFISGAELERRETNWKSALAQYDQAQAQLASQGNQAAYTTLVSDVSGVVTSVDAEVGQVVAAGTPVIRVAQDGVRDAVFSVPEDKVGRIRVGSGAQISAWANQSVYQGTVREVAASADPVTRTFLVKVAIEGPDTLPLGATVTVTPAVFDRSDVRVIKVPTSALRRDGDKSAVWLLNPKDMTVNLQEVQIATADGNDAVISAGLRPGMQVVSAGVHVLSPGQKVTIYRDKYAQPSSATADTSSANAVAR